jgi:hypothetical protein
VISISSNDTDYGIRMIYIGSTNLTYTNYVQQNLDTYIWVSTYQVWNVFSMNSDGLAIKTKYRTDMPMGPCDTGRLLTSDDKEDYIGITSYFVCPVDPSYKLQGS